MTQQLCVPASYMRGGTSKGVFFNTEQMPARLLADAQMRDRFLLRVMGSPDPYGSQMDGMGGATSSTSKVVLVGRSERPDCDLDYSFGQVAIGEPVIDWSGNCGNLSAAVGPFGIAQGLVVAPSNGTAVVRIWQANIRKRIIAHVPMRNGEVVESGDFELDGVAFPAAAIMLEFVDPAGESGEKSGQLCPTGCVSELLEVPGMAPIEVSLINAGNPTVFVAARDLGLTATERQAEVNGNSDLLAMLERIRAHAAVRMGLARTALEASSHRPATPKLMWVAPPTEYTVAGGRYIDVTAVDLVARILSMGKLHHAMTGTGAVAIAVAASIPGTVVAKCMRAGTKGGLIFGHASGVLRVGAATRFDSGQWTVSAVSMQRSARRLMTGLVYVPDQ